MQSEPVYFTARRTEKQKQMRSSFADSSGEDLLETDSSSQTSSGNDDGCSCESDTAHVCDPDDVDSLELCCKPPSYYYEDGYLQDVPKVF